MNNIVPVQKFHGVASDSTNKPIKFILFRDISTKIRIIIKAQIGYRICPEVEKNFYLTP
jgi:hypothetical protein